MRPIGFFVAVLPGNKPQARFTLSPRFFDRFHDPLAMVTLHLDHAIPDHATGTAGCVRLLA